MKKVIAIFILIVTLFASTHVAVALHFCGGNLRSVGFAGTENVSCCGEENHSISDNEGNTIQNIPCCTNHIVETGTDDFPSIQQTASIGSDRDFQTFAFIPFMVSGFRDGFTVNSFQRIFPLSGSIAPSGIDLLISICILRI